MCACMRSWVVVVVRRAPFSSPPRRPSAAASPGPPALLTSPRSTPRPSSSRPRGGTCRCRTRASASSSWRCEPVREGGGREGQARSSVGDVGGRRRGGRTHVPFFARVAAALRRRSSSLWTCSSWPLAPPCERIDRHWSVASLGGGGERDEVGSVGAGRHAQTGHGRDAPVAAPRRDRPRGILVRLGLDEGDREQLPVCRGART